MQEADAHCDRVALMHRGRIRALGTPAELKGAIGPDATLDDVFRRHTGDSLAEEGRHARCPCCPPHRRSPRLNGACAVIIDAEPGLVRTVATAVSRIGTMCLVELQKLRHDRTELLTRAVQPALWLVVFGRRFTQLHAIPTGDVPYLDFLAPGILAQSALFIAIFYGIQIIWERDAGVLAKLLVTPTPRVALVAAKAFAAGIRAIAQAVIVLLLALLLGVGLSANPLHWLGVVVVDAARRGVLLLPVDRDRRARAVARPADGHRAGDHDAAVLRVQRALPGGADARGCR